MFCFLRGCVLEVMSTCLLVAVVTIRIVYKILIILLKSCSQNVEDFESGAHEGPVYSYTRQQLMGATIHKYHPTLYNRMENLRTRLSLLVAGLQPTQEDYLEDNDPKCFDISVLAVIPSKRDIPK